MIICGIEEAGRGPVIGPLVMAGLAIDDKKSALLIKMGVKDSKLLTPEQREALFEDILRLSEEHKIVILSPKDVDDALNDPNMNLNWLEATTTVLILDSLRCDKAILDCPSNNIHAYREYVFSRLKNKVEIIAEHKADAKYPIVSAASIIAKVTRDREIENIKRKFGVNFGSGYPSDPLTKEFLSKNYDKYDFFRKTWSSYRKVADSKKQSFLSSFR